MLPSQVKGGGGEIIMATRGAGTGTETLSIGGLLSRSFGVIGQNPVATLGGAFLLSALPMELVNLALAPTIASGLADFAPSAFLAYMAMVIVMVICGLLLQATIIRAAAAQARGEKASLGECLTTGLAKILPLFLLGLLMGFGGMIGFVLLIVPGIILFIMWSVAAPALVVEDLGPIAALGRSRALTKGYRWTIFGIGLLMLIALWILSAVVGLVMLLFMGLNGLETMSVSIEASSYSPVTIIFGLVFNTLYTAFFAALPASLYLMLREIKEGPQADRLADIFA
jgi:uncharacterized membrane protein